jgi:hypothetical protein
LLAEAGYPIIRPVFQSTEPGKQILVYQIVDSPSVFDSARTVESAGGDFSDIARLQAECDDRLFQIYQDTLTAISPEENCSVPIHQLFFHRLTKGRLQKFYGDGVEIYLPGAQYPVADVLSWRWEINGQLYSETLQQIIARAIDLLDPDQSTLAVIGHGDAHNGNVFLGQSQMVYFDPAFAGRHNPILDLVKPLFHNVFAMWMYFPQEESKGFTCSMNLRDQVCHVEHNYTLHPIREMFLRSKVERVLIPLLKQLKSELHLDPDWRSFLKAGLFCCPFLTMNLADHGRFNQQIALLGISMAVEMGSESTGKKSLIDLTLDIVEDALYQNTP